MKRCPGCGITKPENEFRKDRRRPRGLSWRCRECLRKRERENYARNAKVREQSKRSKHRFYEINKDSILTREKDRRNKIGNRKIWLQRMYGIGEDDYNRMYRQQNGKCPICRSEQPPGKLVVDHDHETGKIRGLLCHKCNLLAGHIENNLDKMYDLFMWIGL
jgi:hypothetical protein